MDVSGNPNIFHLKHGKVIFTGKKFDLFGKLKNEFKSRPLTLTPELMKLALDKYFKAVRYAYKTIVKIQEDYSTGVDMKVKHKNCPELKQFKLTDSGQWQFSYIINLFEMKPFIWLKMIRFEFPDSYHPCANGVLFNIEEDIKGLKKFVNRCTGEPEEDEAPDVDESNDVVFSE